MIQNFLARNQFNREIDDPRLKVKQRIKDCSIDYRAIHSLPLNLPNDKIKNDTDNNEDKWNERLNQVFDVEIGDLIFLVVIRNRAINRKRDWRHIIGESKGN